MTERIQQKTFNKRSVVQFYRKGLSTLNFRTCNWKQIGGLYWIDDELNDVDAVSF